MENRKPNYWENTEPEEVTTGKNVFRFYPEAERLQVSMPDFKKADGIRRNGKTIGVDLSALYEEMEQNPSVESFLCKVFHIGQRAQHE